MYYTILCNVCKYSCLTVSYRGLGTRSNIKREESSFFYLYIFTGCRDQVTA